jgi:hypothetical protein
VVILVAPLELCARNPHFSYIATGAGETQRPRNTGPLSFSAPFEKRRFNAWEESVRNVPKKTNSFDEARAGGTSQKPELRPEPWR